MARFTQRQVAAADALVGEIALPADKSIAHRTALFSAISRGPSRINGFPRSADPRSTLACLHALGVESSEKGSELVVHGRGLRGLLTPDGPLNCGNSGTTMRLITGILAGQSFDSELIGDASLSKRPMGRIIDPLTAMGATIGSHEGRPPLTIQGGHSLTGMSYELPVASAQVKSCVLLAGLYADGPTSVIESEPSRDHTERMLGLDSFTMDGRRVISVEGGTQPMGRSWDIPADFSAAAFFLVAASILDGSHVRLPGVGLNPSRTGLLSVLGDMGADVSIEEARDDGGEPIGTLVVRSAQLKGTTIEGDIIPNVIDEIPILCIAATAAEGVTTIRGAEELRHKESDRIDLMVAGLRAMGAQVEEYPDGLAIEGGHPLSGATIETSHDHRIAMAFAVAGLAARTPVTIEDASVAAVSFPGFYEALDSLR